MVIKQGGLDALCGAYAIINAINRLRPLSKQSNRLLFERLILSREIHGELSSAIIYGTCKYEIEMMLKAAASHLRQKHRVSIKVLCLFRTNKDITVSCFKERLAHYLAIEKTAVLIGLAGRLDHWSCVRKISDTTIYLDDSGTSHSIRLSSCHIGKPNRKASGYFIMPTQTWGLRLEH